MTAPDVDVVAVVDAAISEAFGRPVLRQAVMATLIAERLGERYELVARPVVTDDELVASAAVRAVGVWRLGRATA